MTGRGPLSLAAILVGSTAPAVAAAQIVSATLPSSEYQVRFRVIEAAEFGSLHFTVDYDRAVGEIRGVGTGAECDALVGLGLGLPLFNDCDMPGGCGAIAKRTLVATLTSVTGFIAAGNTDIAACIFDSPSLPSPVDFDITVVDAASPQLVPLDVTVVVGPITSATSSSTTSSTTTTTSTTHTSSTTVAAPPACARPVTGNPEPVASDCLAVLQAAALLRACVPACICAPGGMLPATATDSLICLGRATGRNVELNCPC